MASTLPSNLGTVLGYLLIFIALLQCTTSDTEQQHKNIDSDPISTDNDDNNNRYQTCIDSDGNNINNDECIEDKKDLNYDEIDFSLDPSNYDYPYPCPGLQAGFECDYDSSWSSRDGDHYFCDIETIHINDMTYERFMDEYLFKKPVLLDANLSDWSDPEFWSKKSWLMNYGKYPFEAGRSLELVLNSGIGPVNITLEEYFADHMQLQLDKDVMGPYDAPFKEPLYVFDRSIWREEDEFQLKHFHGPKYLFNTMESNYGILFIGVSGTGATWHAHGETWAANAYGRKRWFVYPPEVSPPGGFWPGYSAKDWYLNIYPHLKNNLTHIKSSNDWNNHFIHDQMENNKMYSTNDPDDFLGGYEFLRHSVRERIVNDDGDGDVITMKLNSDSSIGDIMSADSKYEHNGLHKPFECIQKEGQIIYLPEFWWHAVLNIGDVVAGGIQSSESYEVWMKEIDHLGDIERTLSDKKQKKKHRNLLTDLEKAATHYDMLLIHERLGKHAPFNAVHQFFVGLEYADLYEYPLAEQYLEEGLFMDPVGIENYLALSRIYLDSDRLWHNYLGEWTLRIAYILNHNHPTIREKLMDIFSDQGKKDLVELVSKHKPLPPLIILTEQEMDAKQKDQENKSKRYGKNKIKNINKQEFNDKNNNTVSNNNNEKQNNLKTDQKPLFEQEKESNLL